MNMIILVYGEFDENITKWIEKINSKEIIYNENIKNLEHFPDAIYSCNECKNPEKFDIIFKFIGNDQAIMEKGHLVN